MTNEDAIKFILESQSRMSAHLEAIAERQEKQDALLANLTQTTFNVIGALAGRINDCADRINELAEQGRRTDERISVVVNMVEKWIAENQKRRHGDR
jgi:hypothetical protein